MSIRMKWTKHLALSLLLLPWQAMAYESGSTGADGVFNPTVNTRLPMPPDGVFNFTEVNIPSGVTVTFEKNTTNTPVTILATGDVLIAGTLNLNGSWSTPVGSAGDGNIGDDGIPGDGGPGGFSGGRGGEPDSSRSIRGGNGLGPGAGTGGQWYSNYNIPSGGGGGGFGSGGARANQSNSHGTQAAGGPTYGSELLLPLVGGSGGGGAKGGDQFHGSGGGGGGGAVLIAASGTVTVTGSIQARGGNSGGSSGAGVGGTGGGGSGGAIRIAASRINGNGAIDARGGSRGAASNHSFSHGGNGGNGHIRLEAEIFDRTAATTPAFSFGEPSSVFVSGLPTLRIESVAGIAVPAQPSGYGDVVLPEETPNPATVVFRTSGVPVGNTVRLRVTPAYGHSSSAISPALSGTTEDATASVSITIPDGPSTLQADTTYTVISEEMAALFEPFTGGEAVEQIRLAATLGGPGRTTLVTVSGREIDLPAQFPAWPLSGS